MLFKNIAALVEKGVTVNFAVTAATDGQLEVSVVPTVDSGKTGMGLVARTFTGTPSELDEGFAAVIASFSKGSLTLVEQIAEAQQAFAATETANAATAKEKAEAAKTKPKTPSVVKPTVSDRTPTLSNEDDDDDDIPTGSGESTPAATPAASTTSASQGDAVSFGL
jgi:PRTRC genetic system protein E